MSNIREFEIGEWIVTDDGVCQVLGSQKYYIEPFFAKDFESLKVGDAFENIVVYKIFCDFEGNLRKTKFINWHSSKLCDSISDQYLKIKNKAKKENPEKYKKFLERELNKPVISRVEFSVRVEPDKRDEIIKQMQLLLDSLAVPFDFNTFENSIYKDIKGIISERLTNNDNLKTNVLISLAYDVLNIKDRKFSFINGTVVPTYCAYDQK